MGGEADGSELALDGGEPQTDRGRAHPEDGEWH